MRNTLRTVTAVLAIAAVLIAIPAAAQSPGDMVFVTDRNGVQTRGRLLGLSPEAVTLGVDGQEGTIPSSGVGRVEKRDSLWNGILIGAVPGALVGMAGAGASCSPHCGRDVPLGGLVVGAIGAGIGALIDSGIHGYSIVSGPPLAPPNARRSPEPVASLDDLWLRVREGDRIDVAIVGGQKMSGRLVQASRTSVILMVRGDRREIRSSDVRVVTRAGNRYRSGALWGGVIGGTVGILASASCGSSDGCGNPALAGMAIGSAGALWGTVIGAVIPKHPVVYGSGGFSSVRVSPMLDLSRVGVTLSATF